MGVAGAAGAMVAEHGEHFGARYVITYVGHLNAASLKGVAKNGFVPVELRTQRWRRFRQVSEVTAYEALDAPEPQRQ
jgi:hypothetical protein